MLKLIIGVKGTGKTKRIIQMVNSALETTKGNVVVVEKGDKLMHEVKYTARLVDADKYAIDNAEKLYGFVAGVCASDYDVTDIFIDGTIKICGGVDDFVKIADSMQKLAENDINLVATVNCDIEELPEKLRKYAI